MSSFDARGSRKTYPVVIDAGNDMTEVIVVDGAFQKVADGVRHLELELPAGLFMVKTRLGEHTHERFIQVPEQLRLEDPPEAAPVVSSTPLLEGREWTPDERETEHQLLAQLPELRLGEGLVTVLVRDLSARDSAPDALSLRDLDGHKVASFAESGELRRTRVTGFSARLPAGGVLLQSRSRNVNTLAMALWVAAGFETRVYLERRTVASVDRQGRPDRRRMADLSSASIFILPPGEDLTKGSAAEAARVTEMARTTLATERAIFPPELLREHLDAGLRYPLLGLLGAHLVSLQPEPDFELLEEVVGSLEERLLPGNPDVASLRRYLGHLAGPPVSCPPLLRASWDRLAASASSDARAIGPNGVVAWIGSRLTANRPWLIWNGAWRRRAAPPEEAGTELSATFSELREHTRRDRAAAARLEKEEARTVSGSRITSSLLEAIRDLKHSEPDPLAEISQRLNLPRATVAQELRELKIE